MSVDLEDKLAAMGIMNATAYAKKFAEDEWTWEALVGCSDEKLDVLVQRVGMKEGSALTFMGRGRDARAARPVRSPTPTRRASHGHACMRSLSPSPSHPAVSHRHPPYPLDVPPSPAS